MYILNVVAENPILFGTLGFIVVFNLLCILYLVMKERKQNTKEEEIVANLVTEPEEKREMLQLEEVLEEMQKNLEATPEEAVYNFEQEQEEKSIISYQELVEALKSEEPIFTEMKEEMQKEMNTSVNEELKDQLKETIQTIEINKKEAEEALQKTMEPVPEKKKLFKATEFISPIFGKAVNKKETGKTRYERHKIEVEVSSDDLVSNKVSSKMEEIFSFDRGIDKNDEFLNSLKEFRKKLE